MSEPPAYETCIVKDWDVFDDGLTKGATRWSIREEIATSRTQHVAVTLEQLLPQIRQRAQQGLSKTDLILIPSGQDAALHGQLVDVAQDRSTVYVQFRDAGNGVQFWGQMTALTELKRQLKEALTDTSNRKPANSSSSPAANPIMPERPPRKSSWFGRKSARELVPTTQQEAQVVEPDTVSVKVMLDDVHFRTETPYGLFETKSAKAVFISIVVAEA